MLDTIGALRFYLLAESNSVRSLEPDVKDSVFPTVMKIIENV